jgi:hypothetical protein
MAKAAHSKRLRRVATASSARPEKNAARALPGRRTLQNLEEIPA